ncbi:CbiX/SirB N-terminal domain-containing protein, partial [Neobacillus drentensis]|uniref:sirohydrochlorin chelatase n=1 Tax=Neobacillus drentensis TaxID=220684 RepID=UPI00300307B8
MDEAVRQAELPEGMPVEVVFLEIVEGRLIQDGIDRLEAKGVTDLLVIPFFVSGGSTHLDEIAYALGVKAKPAIETDLDPFRVRANVYFGQPMDSDPEELAKIILEKHHKNLGAEESKDSEVLLLVAHGSDHPVFYERWVEGIQRIADEVRKQGEFVEVDTALLLPDQMYDKIIRWQ